MIKTNFIYVFYPKYGNQECIYDIYMVGTLHSEKILILLKERDKYALILVTFQTFNRSENRNLMINKNEISTCYNLHQHMI